ncbi:hypothetical protein HanRHA438_Chr09g0407381 [Helianthus annuus]|nr:hypothetical protein HanRHA438_Chr09g0407381 [Helianthus annuus]
MGGWVYMCNKRGLSCFMVLINCSGGWKSGSAAAGAYKLFGKFGRRMAEEDKWW